MHFTIVSSTATDLVALGDSRAAVRETLGSPTTFRRTAASDESDQFASSGAMATYSSVGALVMLELADPARVEIDGVQLLGKSLDDVESELGEKDINISRDDMGAMIPSVSVGLYAPAGTVEGVQLGSD
jgi:hypothetical protein